MTSFFMLARLLWLSLLMLSTEFVPGVWEREGLFNSTKIQVKIGFNNDATFKTKVKTGAWQKTCVRGPRNV